VDEVAVEHDRHVVEHERLEGVQGGAGFLVAGVGDGVGQSLVRRELRATAILPWSSSSRV